MKMQNTNISMDEILSSISKVIDESKHENKSEKNRNPKLHANRSLQSNANNSSDLSNARDFDLQTHRNNSDMQYTTHQHKNHIRTNEQTTHSQNDDAIIGRDYNTRNHTNSIIEDNSRDATSATDATTHIIKTAISAWLSSHPELVLSAIQDTISKEICGKKSDLSSTIEKIVKSEVQKMFKKMF